MENPTKHEIEFDWLVINTRISMQNNGDCHHNSKLAFEELKKLGYNVRLVSGVFMRDDGVNIRHSWLEFENKILETDAEQLHIKSDFPWKIIEDEETKGWYKKLPAP
jgi:hypothetical protein